jgi:hypothetical protein
VVGWRWEGAVVLGNLFGDDECQRRSYSWRQQVKSRQRQAGDRSRLFHVLTVAVNMLFGRCRGVAVRRSRIIDATSPFSILFTNI